MQQNKIEFYQRAFLSLQWQSFLRSSNYRLVTKFTGLLLCVFILDACSSAAKKNPTPTATPEVASEYQKIKAKVNTDRWDVSAKRLQQFIARHPNSDVSDDAALTLGQLLESQKRYNEAYLYYMKLVEAPTSSPLEGPAIVAATRCLGYLGRPDEALALSEKGLKNSSINNDQIGQLHELRFEIYRQLGQRSDSLGEAAWLATNSSGETQKDFYRNKLNEAIDATTDENTLTKMLSESNLKPFHAVIALKAGRLAYERNEFTMTRFYMEKAINLAKGTPQESSIQITAKQYLDQIDVRRKVRADTIGLVVPLTGKYSHVGYKALRGVQLAIGTFWSKGTPLQLAVVDSEGNSDLARRAVERLVNEDNVIAIIGGLTSKTASQEASKAQEMGVPFIALSQAQALTEIGDYIFRNSLTSRIQVNALIQQAKDRWKVKNFAILYPNDPYGQEFAHAFFDEAQRQGGEIRAIQTYDPQETDFKEAVRKISGLYYSEERADESRMPSSA